MKGGSKVIIEPHRHEGIFIAKGKEDALVTKNLVPGEAVYNEKRISVQVSFFECLIFDVLCCYRDFVILMYGCVIMLTNICALF